MTRSHWRRAVGRLADAVVTCVAVTVIPVLFDAGWECGDAHNSGGFRNMVKMLVAYVMLLPATAPCGLLFGLWVLGTEGRE